VLKLGEVKVRDTEEWRQMTSKDSNSDPQGSAWRRWDPHVHFPGTLFNDQFKGTGIEQALDVLGSRQPSIEAVGVTNYFTTAGFHQVWESWKKGAGSSIKYLFPNVELRLDIPTSRGAGVNLHILCPPEEADNLDRFLGGLWFTWNDRRYRADRSGLIELGRAFRNDRSLAENVAFQQGAKQFKVSFEELRGLFQSDRWASENCLIAVAGSQGDGSSGVRATDGSFVARRQSIEKFANIVFCSNPKQAEFWLGRGADSVERLQQIYGGVKLCLHGSDAHSTEKLGVVGDDRFTWLKGNLSFETLRMACLAPESRAKIGPLPPNSGQSYGRISRINVRTSESKWIAPTTIPINPGLVAIIGARGSGKTALADLIAVGAGSSQPFDNPASFISRASPLLRGSLAEVEWSHGEISRQDCYIYSPQRDEAERGVRYLSQQFVEQLCAADGISDDLLVEIERVVFNAFPVDQRQGATTFDELLDIRLGAARARQSTELYSIIEIGDAIAEQQVLQQSSPKKIAERGELQKTVAGLQAQINGLTSQAASDKGDRLAQISAAHAARQEQLQGIQRKITALDALKTEVQLARTSTFPRNSANLREKHVHAGLDDALWEAFAIDFVGDVDRILDEALAKARREYQRVAGSVRKDDSGRVFAGLAADQLVTQTLADLRAEKLRLEHLVGLDDQRRKKLVKLDDQLAVARSRVARLDAEIDRATAADQQIAALTQSRLDHYAAYFDALLEEEHELKELYAPLRNFLDGFGASVAKLRFSVRRKVDIGSWASEGESHLDLRKTGSFRGAGELARLAAEKLGPAWESGDGATVAEAVKSFSAEHSNEFRKQSKVGRDDPAAYREWARNVSRWMYSAGHVSLSYSLEYDGLNIERLSPGSRGIVLLLLYLAVDQDETDPLIIDQPEENLDPESVYSELVDLFRSASERRQIIMITHNANLVINTDVDQVIVAHCGSLEEGRLPELNYSSGGLEEPRIRKAVCEVLEGGAEAFRQRARRLRIDIGI
jgi:energy-coupling factor transporter ATP-binding protein EcfA2